VRGEGEEGERIRTHAEEGPKLDSVAMLLLPRDVRLARCAAKDAREVAEDEVVAPRSGEVAQARDEGAHEAAGEEVGGDAQEGEHNGKSAGGEEVSGVRGTRS